MPQIDVRFRSLPSWTGKPTKNRRSLPGEQTYSQILERLEKELTHLKARDVVIETGHRDTEIRLDGWIRSNARVPSHPGVILWFTAKAVRGGSEVGDLRYECDTYRTWQENLRAIVLTLEDLRRIEGRGATSKGEQYRGYAALPPAPTGNEAKRKALKHILAVARGYEPSPAQIDAILQDSTEMKDAYNEARKKTHPDVSGNADFYHAVVDAWKILTGETGGNS